MPFEQAVMAPTRIYVKPLLQALLSQPIKAMAHITGGGLIENLPRVLPPGVSIELNRRAWPKSELFDWIQTCAALDEIEMNRTFNNGIGMALIIDERHAQACTQMLQSLGEEVYSIGRVVPIQAQNERVHIS
jgi:phosphoribosylformylglycinamidine cyclo-ligase